MKANWKNLLTAIALPLAVGGLSTLLTGDGIRTFSMNVNQPAFTPPAWLFPIVWTILFVLMGIASYLVTQKNPQPAALLLYAVQLLLNLLWTIFFFEKQWYLFSFFWILLLWIFILATLISFYRISKFAGYLLLPYLLWVGFAAYLNYCVYLLN